MNGANFRRKNRKTAIISARTARFASVFTILLLIGALALQSSLHGHGAGTQRELLSFQLPFFYGLKYETEEPEEFIDRQAHAAQEENAIKVELTEFDEGVSDEIRLELLKVTAGQEQIPLAGLEPRVLIYHTHTTEAYTPTSRYAYTASGEFRTRQSGCNVTALGARLAALLKEKYGIIALHDTTDHEPPKLSTAYDRSLATMLNYKKEYPSLTLFIDLHRDAYGDSPAGAKDYVIVNGKETARLMFVVGTGKGSTGAGYKEMPDFASNYALAKRMTERLKQFDPRIMRDIRVKNGRYNQHVSNQCLLVEVGHNANTFEQAYNAIELLAQAIADVAGIEYEQEGAVETLYRLAP